LSMLSMLLQMTLSMIIRLSEKYEFLIAFITHMCCLARLSITMFMIYLTCVTLALAVRLFDKHLYMLSGAESYC
jgi:hypothetical protein